MGVGEAIWLLWQGKWIWVTLNELKSIHIHFRIRNKHWKGNYLEDVAAGKTKIQNLAKNVFRPKTARRCFCNHRNRILSTDLQWTITILIQILFPVRFNIFFWCKREKSVVMCIFVCRGVYINMSALLPNAPLFLMLTTWFTLLRGQAYKKTLYTKITREGVGGSFSTWWTNMFL